MKTEKTNAPKEAEPSEIDADLDDQLAVYSEPGGTMIDRIHEANKAIIAAVGSIATVAIALGVGDSETWGQVAAIVAAILTIVGVFAVGNDEPA